MFFQLKEFLSWLGLTVFEVTTFAISFLVFTVLLTLKTELQFLDWKTADRSGHKCNLIILTTLRVVEKLGGRVLSTTGSFSTTGGPKGVYNT